MFLTFLLPSLLVNFISREDEPITKPFAMVNLGRFSFLPSLGTLSCSSRHKWHNHCYIYLVKVIGAFRPSIFTWYCLLNSGFKTCPWYHSYASIALFGNLLFVSLWIVTVPIKNRSHIMHTIALWLWGFAGFCVLCKIHFAFFIEHLMAFVIFLSWQIVLTLCCQPCRFIFLDVLLLLLCVAAASWLSAMQCLFIFSLIIFLCDATTSILSALQHLFLYSLMVILRFATASMPSASKHLFIYSLLIFLSFAFASMPSAWRIVFLLSKFLSFWALFFLLLC